MSTVLLVKNLYKNFNSAPAVKNVSLEVSAGEIFTIIGPNGSGKTTIVKSIAGLLHPTKGEISINGINTASSPVKAKSRIGYIPDKPEIWPSITGEEFLYLMGSLYRMGKGEVEKKIPELLKIFDLSGIEKNYYEDYSRGNKQKFTILAALLHEPDLLLIDEPIVGLDPISAEIAQNKFIEFTKKGGAILLVTHDLTVATNISRTIGVLSKGRLMAKGSFKQLKNKAGLAKNSKLADVYKKLT
jgi:ABC-2 type transport system ATP-binding protein